MACVQCAGQLQGQQVVYVCKSTAAAAAMVSEEEENETDAQRKGPELTSTDQHSHFLLTFYIYLPISSRSSTRPRESSVSSALIGARERTVSQVRGQKGRTEEEEEEAKVAMSGPRLP